MRSARRAFAPPSIQNLCRNDHVVVDTSVHAADDQMNFLYGKPGSATVQQASDGSLCVQLDLAPHQFVILE